MTLHDLVLGAIVSVASTAVTWPIGQWAGLRTRAWWERRRERRAGIGLH